MKARDELVDKVSHGWAGAESWVGSHPCVPGMSFCGKCTLDQILRLAFISSLSQVSWCKQHPVLQCEPSCFMYLLNDAAFLNIHNMRLPLLQVIPELTGNMRLKLRYKEPGTGPQDRKRTGGR